ncbi:MAG TPA: PKD domain-containing protein [Rhodothermales bacterium]|nr:PKD domain-containing protein [Rhodothermales bacterium]
MTRSLWILTLFVISGVLAQSVAAQAMRPEQSWYLRPHVGISSYVGDQDKAFFSSGDGFPYNVGAEIGYQFSYPLSLGLGYQLGNYPGISPLDANDNSLGDDKRHTVRLLLRYMFGSETGVAPYIQTGGHVTFGKVTRMTLNDVPDPFVEETETAFGALLGLGVDIPVSNSLSFFIEGVTHPTFPDDAVDGREDEDGASFDLLTTLGAGLKINFKSAYVAPEVLEVNGPERLLAGETGSYSARINADRVTMPVEYRWDWGDGNMSTGIAASHSYARPGTYTIKFSATNRAGTASQTMRVDVLAIPAEIVTISANPTNPDTRTPVRFRSTVQGDPPLRYNWDFGDGGRSTEAEPVYTFNQPGTYTVTLNLSNDTGNDSRTLSITVLPYEAEVCREVTVMSSAYFDRNSSTLNDRAKLALRDNVDILAQCPNMDVRIVGHAGADERQQQRLSEDRARAVEGYYAQQGIARSRMLTVGEGADNTLTSKKDGASQARRVDTIPMR